MLSSDFAIKGGMLYDIPIGARHSLQGEGEHIMRSIAQCTHLTDIYVVAERYNIPRRDIHELLGLLNLLGALRRIRSTRQQVHAWAIQTAHLLLGVWYTPVTWRKVVTKRSLLAAIMRATAPVSIAASVVCGFIALCGLFPAVQTIGAGFLAYSLFIASLFLHESAHIYYIHAFHTTPVILQRGMRLGIVHPALPRHAELQAALAGPAWGLGTCLIIAGLCLCLHLHTAAIACGIVGTFHITSLLPWYSDGATLRKALKGS